ncbi:MAG: hypothetical protein DI533_22440 [Cereibacter sphaeroides]|uniref:Uncharacterized protein n=1 Tax=Cereibacter sphaeroides TaxID=1063 RepID=A0A2W5TU33_CERSP|nr:MAG: hypothetical protein DI533_22440 [Cereibacter sphaeroides]
MHIIDSNAAMAHVLATTLNPWLRRRLLLHRVQHQEVGCDIGELGPILLIEPGDTLAAVQTAAGANVTSGWEYHQVDYGWHELVFVLSDDGAGAVLFIPDRDDMDADLLGIIRAATEGG